MARKTVLRRCSKAAPTGSDIERLLGRDEELPQVHSQTRLQQIPPRPQREDFMIDPGEQEERDPEDEPVDEVSFEVIDLDGVVHEHGFAAAAREALVDLIDEAKSRGRAAVEGIWESNAETVREIGEAIEDGAEPLHQAYAEALETLDPKSEVEEQRAARPDPQKWGAAGQVQRLEQDQRASAELRAERDNAGTLVKTDAATPADAPGSLAVPVREGPRRGTSDWPGTAQDMIARIAKLTDPEEAAPNGRFKEVNRKTLDTMRISNKEAWSSVEYHLGDRYRLLRQGT
jgi:hypothetical protein